MPIYIDAKKRGELIVEKRGQWTIADARLEDVGRVVRLRVYGDREFYLGVPVPEGEGLRLTRRLSPAEARRFPRQPRYAAERPAEAEPAPEEGQKRRVLWLGGRAHYF